jgi:phosphatidylserine decarboxylase
MVGAGGVGNIRLAPGLWVAPGLPGARVGSGVTGDSASWRVAREPRRVELSGVTVKRGDELGAFRLGSTVVVVFEPHNAELVGAVGEIVRFGQRIGRRIDIVGGAL